METEILTALKILITVANITLPKKTSPLHQLNCKTCQQRNTHQYITDHRGTRHKTQPFRCTQKDVVYCITRTTCEVLYAGYTTRKLKDCMTIYRSTIRNRDSGERLKDVKKNGEDLKLVNLGRLNLGSA
jgi:hypothetical protein